MSMLTFIGHLCLFPSKLRYSGSFHGEWFSFEIWICLYYVTSDLIYFSSGFSITLLRQGKGVGGQGAALLI